MKIIHIHAIWCPACLIMKKRWKSVLKDFLNYESIYYDYDFDEEKVSKFDIGKILPVSIFIKDGKEVERIIGEKTEKELIEKLKEYK